MSNQNSTRESDKSDSGKLLGKLLDMQLAHLSRIEDCLYGAQGRRGMLADFAEMKQDLKSIKSTLNIGDPRILGTPADSPAVTVARTVAGVSGWKLALILGVLAAATIIYLALKHAGVV